MSCSYAWCTKWICFPWLWDKTLHYRIIIETVPTTTCGNITDVGNVDLCQSLQAGGCGNKLLLPLNADIGVVSMYDRTFKIEGDGVVYTKEQHKRIDTAPSQKNWQLLNNHMWSVPKSLLKIPSPCTLLPTTPSEVYMRTTSRRLCTRWGSHTRTCRGR